MTMPKTDMRAVERAALSEHDARELGHLEARLVTANERLVECNARAGAVLNERDRAEREASRIAARIHELRAKAVKRANGRL